MTQLLERSAMRKSVPPVLETKQLPDFNYLGLDRIIVPVTADEFAAAVSHIESVNIVGFDTESRPTFEKGEVSDGPHVVQFASETQAYIFQLCNPESHKPLVHLLAAEDVKKIGFDLGSDRKLLLKKFGMLPRGLVDLRPVFKRQGYRNTVGIRAAVAIVFNEQFHKSKHVTMSNWRNPILTSAQLLYAANDAHAALRVYLQLLNSPNETA
jgi:ribonuclease D